MHPLRVDDTRFIYRPLQVTACEAATVLGRRHEAVSRMERDVVGKAKGNRFPSHTKRRALQVCVLAEWLVHGRIE